MKAIISWFLAFSLAGIAAGTATELDEFCVVQDSDGYTNIREKGDLKSKVIARVDHGQLVWVFLGGTTKWPEIIFMDKKGKERSGFIHASRLKALSDFKHFTGKVSEKDRTETIEKGDLKVKITLEPFDRKKRKLIYQEVEGSRYLSKIDGLPFWGTDGGIPSEQYQKITVQNKGKTMKVPDEALKNLYNPGLFPGNNRHN